MIDTPEITRTEALEAAVIHVTVPRAEIRTAMPVAIRELHAALSTQGRAPRGPMFSHHLRIAEDVFDFEVGFPVDAPVTPTGRVKPGALPACRVARTVYHGPYEGLHRAWEQFDDWIVAQGEIPGPAVWECYLAGPESSSDATAWRTELVRPIDAHES